MEPQIQNANNLPEQNTQPAAPSNPQFSQSPVIQKKKSNILWVILAVLIGLMLLCCGCGFLLVRMIPQQSGVDLNTLLQELEKNNGSLSFLTPSPTPDNQNNTINPTPEENSSTESSDSQTPISRSLPGDFPKDIPIYPNSQVELSTQDTPRGRLVNFTVDVNADDVKKFFEIELPKQGWSIDSQFDLFGKVVSASKDNRTVNIVIVANNNSATYVITYDEQ